MLIRKVIYSGHSVGPCLQVHISKSLLKYLNVMDRSHENQHCGLKINKKESKKIQYFYISYNNSYFNAFHIDLLLHQLTSTIFSLKYLIF